MPKRISKSLKEQVGKRAGLCCEYCRSQADFSPDSFSVEHIIPIAKGGTDDLDNLAYSCQGCNNRKYNHIEAIDPVTNTIVRLFHPRQQQWTGHFQWNPGQTMLTGLTPTGRATIEKLGLNRKGVVNLRYLLVLIGEHPPR